MIKYDLIKLVANIINNLFFVMRNGMQTVRGVRRVRVMSYIIIVLMIFRGTNNIGLIIIQLISIIRIMDQRIIVGIVVIRWIDLCVLIGKRNRSRNVIEIRSWGWTWYRSGIWIHKRIGIGIVLIRKVRNIDTFSRITEMIIIHQTPYAEKNAVVL